MPNNLKMGGDLLLRSGKQKHSPKVDKTDENQQSEIVSDLEIPTIVTNTIMVTLQDRVDLGSTTLRFLQDLAV